METNTRDSTVVQLAPARRVLLPLAAQITGLTEKAMRRKIQEGKWLEGREYLRDPDGRLWVDIEGVMRWVGRGQA